MYKNNNPTDDEMLAMARQNRRISREELGIDTPGTQDGLETLNEGFDFLQHKDDRIYRNDSYNELPTEPEDYLKPCPFCGVSNTCLYFVTVEQAGYKTLGIFCNNCKQTVTLEINEWEGDSEKSRSRAIEAWNRRVGEQDG